MAVDFKNKMTGAFGLLMLFSDGLNKFSGTKQAALKSLLIPLLLFPVGMWFATIYPPKGMEEGYGLDVILTYVAAQTVISFLFATLAVYVVAHLLKCGEKFWLYLEASNWTGLAFAIVTLPFVAMAAYEIFPREEMDRIIAIITMYGYLVTACIVWKSFRTFWQIAGATSVLTLFVNNESSHLLYYMLGVPIPW